MKHGAPFQRSLLSLLGVCAVAAACGGSSGSRRSGASGAASGAAGRGDSAGASTGGRAASAGGNTAGSAGTGAASGGSIGDATGGVSGAATAGVSQGAAGSGGVAASGGAGAGADNAGEQSGGADNGGSNACLNLCKEDTPACCTPGLECVRAVPRCRIDILEGNVDLTSKYADIAPQIEPLFGDVLLSIPDEAVALAAADPSPAARFEFTLSERGTELYAAALKTLYTQPFRLSCDDETLFVGLIYNRNGAAALSFPVLHIEQTEGGPVRLLLGATLGEWTGLHGFSAEEDKQRIDRTELRATFCARGILAVLEPP